MESNIGGMNDTWWSCFLSPASSWCVLFISCSVPAGSGPALYACPGFPLWHLIISLQREKAKPQGEQPWNISTFFFVLNSWGGYLFTFTGLSNSIPNKTVQRTALTGRCFAYLLQLMCATCKNIKLLCPYTKCCLHGHVKGLVGFTH